MPFNSPRHRTFKCLSHFNNSSFSLCWKWREKIFFSSASVEVSDVLKLSGKVFVCSEGFHWLQWFLRIRINSLYLSYICSNWKRDLMSEGWKHRPRRNWLCVCVCLLHMVWNTSVVLYVSVLVRNRLLSAFSKQNCKYKSSPNLLPDEGLLKRCRTPAPWAAVPSDTARSNCRLFTYSWVQNKSYSSWFIWVL